MDTTSKLCFKLIKLIQKKEVIIIIKFVGHKKYKKNYWIEEKRECERIKQAITYCKFIIYL